MGLREGFRLAWHSIAANKVRSLLTALGVIIGVAAVIALVAVGQGASSQITSRVAALGANLLIVSPQRNQGAVLTLQNIAPVPSRVHEVSAMMPLLQGSVTARWTDQSWATTLQGVSQNFPEVRSATLQEGTFFSAADVTGRRHVAVLGVTVAQQLGMPADSVGQQITLNGQPFTVVGVLTPTGGNAAGQNQDDMVVVPVTTAETLLGTVSLSSVYFTARSQALAPLAAGHLQTVFDHMFGDLETSASTVPPVRILSQVQILNTLSQTTQTLTLLLGSVAAVSLLVGGIGIMNIMLVSVAERTREIGIRKAVGARRRDVLAQFLLEALTLSVAGGVLGIGAGVAAARLLAATAQWSTAVSPEAVGAAFAFALAVGVGFGVWPASKAAGLDPIQALHYE